MNKGLQVAYAHTLPDSQEGEWEPLAEHLEEVARLCGIHASAFNAADWGWLAGICHDLGKASEEFQAYLRMSSRDRENAGEETSSGQRIDHSTFGARYVACALPGPVGRVLAFSIAGHHAGLPDAFPRDDLSGRSSLSARLNPSITRIPYVNDPDLKPTTPVLFLNATPESKAFALAFFTRMLFSCLVDADRICTEAFCDPDAAKERALLRPSLCELREKLDAYLGAC